MAKRHKYKSMDLMKIHGIKAKIDYQDIIDRYGQKTADKLKSVSPDSHRNRTTPYRLGWETIEKAYKQGRRVLVWNRTNWQLTHLLENGHFITNKIGGVGWAASQPHILPTYRDIRPKFIKAMQKADVEVNLY